MLKEGVLMFSSEDHVFHSLLGASEGKSISSNHSRWVISGRYWEYSYLQVSWPRIHQRREGFCIQNSPFPWGQDCWPWCSCTFGHSQFLLERVELRFKRKSNFLFLSLKPQNCFFQDIGRAIHLVFLCLWSLQEAHTSGTNRAVCGACLVRLLPCPWSLKLRLLRRDPHFILLWCQMWSKTHIIWISFREKLASSQKLISFYYYLRQKQWSI